MNDVILFDGVCNLCNNWVDFVIRRDGRGHFRFGALQSEAGRKLLAERGVSSETLTGVYLVRTSDVHTKSGAVLRVLSKLSGLWPVFSVFLIVPSFLRDAVYDFIAARRYKWFGKRDTCRLPTTDEARRFIA